MSGNIVADDLKARKPWYKIFIRKLLLFISIFLIALIFKASTDAYIMGKEHFNNEWAKLGCPYDIQKEYRIINIIDHVRKYLLTKGFSNDNLIESFLKSKQKEYFKKMKFKANVNDIAFELIWLRIEFLDSLLSNERNSKLANIIENNINSYYIENSRIKGFDRLIKFQKINTLINYMIKSGNFENTELCKDLLANNHIQEAYDNNDDRYLKTSNYINTLTYCFLNDMSVQKSNICDNYYFNHVLKSIKMLELDKTYILNHNRNETNTSHYLEQLLNIEKQFLQIKQEKCNF